MIFGTYMKENTLTILDNNIMITIEDIKRYADMQNELEKICIAYFQRNANEWEMYDGFSLEESLCESGFIKIHYHFMNYMDEWDNDTIEVSYEELIEFAINNI